MRSGRPKKTVFQPSQLYLWSLLLAITFISSQSFSNQNPPQALSNYTELPHHELIPDPSSTAEDLFVLFQDGRAFTKEQMSRLGPERFLKAVRDGQMVYEHPEKGVVEFTNIDGMPAARIIYEPTDVVYLFLDSNLVEKESSHLRKYLAKQHHLSGMSRDDGINGRDVVVIWLNGHEIVEVEQAHKPTPLSWVFWKTYAQAHYKKPSLDNFVFGSFCGTVQAAAGFAVNCVASLIDPSIPISYNVSMLNFAFGTFLGTYAKTYASWVYSGKSKMKSIFKSSVVSALYAYTLVGLQGGWGALMPSDSTSGLASGDSGTFGDLKGVNLEGVEEPLIVQFESGDSLMTTPYNNFDNEILNPIQPELSHEPIAAVESEADWVANNVQILANIALNNYGKVEWAQPFKVLNIEKKDTGEKYYSIPFSSKKIKVKQRDINFQLKAYLPAQAFRTIDLLSIGVGSSLAVSFSALGGFDVKYSTMLFIASSVAVHTWVRHWANKKHKDAAKKLKLDESYSQKIRNKFVGLGKSIKSILSLKPTKEKVQMARRKRAVHHHTKEVIHEMSSLKGMYASGDCAELLLKPKAAN